MVRNSTREGMSPIRISTISLLILFHCFPTLAGSSLNYPFGKSCVWSWSPSQSFACVHLTSSGALQAWSLSSRISHSNSQVSSRLSAIKSMPHGLPYVVGDCAAWDFSQDCLSCSPPLRTWRIFQIWRPEDGYWRVRESWWHRVRIQRMVLSVYSWQSAWKTGFFLDWGNFAVFPGVRGRAWNIGGWRASPWKVIYILLFNSNLWEVIDAHSGNKSHGVIDLNLCQ